MDKFKFYLPIIKLPEMEKPPKGFWKAFEADTHACRLQIWVSDENLRVFTVLYQSMGINRKFVYAIGDETKSPREAVENIGTIIMGILEAYYLQELNTVLLCGLQSVH